MFQIVSDSFSGGGTIRAFTIPKWGTAAAALLLALFAASAGAAAQSAAAVPASGTAQPVTITLDDAIHRAEANDPAYAATAGNKKIGALDQGIARSAFLPDVHYFNQFLYTQGNGLFTAAADSGSAATIGHPIAAPVFIANNAVHEYLSQGVVNETIGLAQVSAYRQAKFAAAQLTAQQEIARRGLVATVVSYYYTLLAADLKYQVTQRAEDEARNFTSLTQKLEQGREVAHADTVKADLTLQQRERDLGNAKLAADKARLDFAVLLFSDPRTNFTLADDSTQPPPPPSRADVEAAAAHKNPDIAAAVAALHASQQGVTSARAAYLPSLALNYTYGIDAAQFAVNSPDHVPNLGYSASATLDIPVWDWFATHDRVKQSEVRRQVAQVQLSYTQKRLMADLDELYNEAAISHEQLGSLDQSVQAAAESLRLTMLRYQAGEATALEVVAAQDQLVQIETARADGVTRYRVALANLQTLTGIL